MKKLFGNIDKQWKVYALAACVTVLFASVITHISLCVSYIKTFLGFFGPVILGVVIAYILNPLAKEFDKRIFVFIKKEKLRWTLSVFISLILVLVLIVLLVVSLIPQFVVSIKTFLDNMNSYLANLESLLDTLSARFGIQSSELMAQIEERIVGDDGILSKAGTYISNNITKIIRTTTNAGSTVANFAISVIVALYFLVAKDSMLGACRRLFGLLVTSESNYSRSMEVWGKFNKIFSSYIACELIDALLVGAANYLFMTIMKMPSALIVSCVVGVCNLAPTFGPVIGAVVGGVILLLVRPASVIPFIIFTVVLQTIDGYVLKPKLFGNVLAVPSSLILIAIIVFGRMFGITGMLVAIPVAAIMVYLYKELLIPALEARKEKRQSAAKKQ